MPRKKKPTPTELQHGNQPETDRVVDAEEVLGDSEASNPAQPIIDSLADATRVPDDREATQREVADAMAKVEENTDTPLHTLKPNFAEKTQRADPFPFNSVQFPDGYKIHLQESDSRRTVEIQFGEGTRKDQPQNFAAIKDVLRSAGMHWNGSNAWVVDLAPVRGSFAQREDAKQRNKEIRAEIEEKVFPAVVGLEEQARGEIPFTDDFRQRIQKAVSGGNGRA